MDPTQAMIAAGARKACEVVGCDEGQGAALAAAIFQAMHAAHQSRELPRLDDIMAAGFGLTDALAWSNEMMNTPGHAPAFWWEQLRFAARRRSASSPRAKGSLSGLQ